MCASHLGKETFQTDKINIQISVIWASDTWDNLSIKRIQENIKMYNKSFLESSLSKVVKVNLQTIL